MKIELTKKGMTRYCQPGEIEQMQAAGWQQVNGQSAVKETAEEKIILRPPAKSKGADKSLDNAIQQGDE